MKPLARLNVLLLPFLLPTVAIAQWQPEGVLLTSAPGSQILPIAVVDGEGGAIVAWLDQRTGTYDIYVQRLNSAGVVLWTANGVPIGTETGDQDFPVMVADGAGGAIIAWRDQRPLGTGNYAQRVNSAGGVEWATNGILVTNAADIPTITSDGAGGAVVGFERSNQSYAQRLSPAGELLWGSGAQVGGVPSGGVRPPVMIPDGAGGVLAAWQDSRGPNSDIYAQRLSALGERLWTPDDGVPICLAMSNQMTPIIVSDDAGGAIIAWTDGRAGSGFVISAQRVNSSGVVVWTPDGVGLGADVGGAPVIATDGAGGAIVAWNISHRLFGIYVQRLNSAGSLLWGAGGVNICTGYDEMYNQEIVSDDRGGAIVTWQDLRDFPPRVFTQQVSASGSPLWAPNGIAVSTAPGVRMNPAIVSDTDGGAIIVWEGYMNTPSDIYAQRMVVAPVSVAITAFEVLLRDGGVLLKGAFRSDLGVELVRVYRGRDDQPLMPIDTAAPLQEGRFEYLDQDVVGGGTYHYQVGVIDDDGEFMSPVEMVSVPAIESRLEQNWPNPFNPKTTILFALSTREHVELDIYDAAGRQVRSLLREVREPGPSQVDWDGRDDEGKAMASGVYFYRMRAGGFHATRKMILLK